MKPRGFPAKGSNRPRRSVKPKARHRRNDGPWLWLPEPEGAKEADCVQSAEAVQGAGPGIAASDAGGKHRSGWRGYFAYCETPSALRDLDSWVRRRLRCVVWKQWKRGYTRLSSSRCQTSTSTRSVFRRWRHGGSLNQPNRRVRTRTHGAVTGKAGDRLPMSILSGSPTAKNPLTVPLRAWYQSCVCLVSFPSAEQSAPGGISVSWSL